MQLRNLIFLCLPGKGNKDIKERKSDRERDRDSQRETRTKLSAGAKKLTNKERNKQNIQIDYQNRRNK